LLVQDCTRGIWVHTSLPIWPMAGTILRVADKHLKSVACQLFLFSRFTLQFYSLHFIWCLVQAKFDAGGCPLYLIYRKDVNEKTVFWACKGRIYLVLLPSVCSFTSFDLEAHLCLDDLWMLDQKRFWRLICACLCNAWWNIGWDLMVLWPFLVKSILILLINTSSLTHWSLPLEAIISCYRD
jgi:hypothetical protein